MAEKLTSLEDIKKIYEEKYTSVEKDGKIFYFDKDGIVAYSSKKTIVIFFADKDMLLWNHHGISFVCIMDGYSLNVNIPKYMNKNGEVKNEKSEIKALVAFSQGLCGAMRGQIFNDEGIITRDVDLYDLSISPKGIISGQERTISVLMDNEKRKLFFETSDISFNLLVSENDYDYLDHGVLPEIVNIVKLDKNFKTSLNEDKERYEALKELNEWHYSSGYDTGGSSFVRELVSKYEDGSPISETNFVRIKKKRD